ISDKVSSINEKDDSRKFLKQLFVSRGAKEPAELAASLFCEVVPTAAHFSQALAHAINFYLDETRRESYEEIVNLLCNHATDVHQKLRMIHQFLVSISRRRRKASLVEANKNRPQNQDGVFGITEHGLLYSPLFTLVRIRYFRRDEFLSHIARCSPDSGTVLSLLNVRRAPGESGKLNRFIEYQRGAPLQQYVTYEGGITPFPDSFVLQVTFLRFDLLLAC
ncbi:hypothetical protein MPER_00984, partial [Moniliophthora perniciosa FA553]